MMKPLQSRLIIMALILQACFAIPLNCAASPISRQQAQQNALNFLHERGKTVAVASLRHAPMRATMNDASQPYYVFNIGNNQGYVIASGDDCAYPVLGYSDEGFIDVNDLPCNLQAWLDSYARQIKHLQEHHATPSRAPKKTDYPPAIEPLLTCRWGQGLYRQIDPTTGEQCSAGCAAVSMAQVMYYHRDRSVSQTTYEIPAYVTRTLGIQIDAIPAGSFIDWENMVDYPYGTNATEVQKQAVANLMKYCGAAVQMDYTSSGSSSTISHQKFGLYFFNYSSKVKSVSNSRYSDEEWEELIYSELCQSRPVLMGAILYLGAHSFVCDGYDGNGYFHFNWGWGGSSDGYYLLTPTETSNDGMIKWQDEQYAIIHVEPRETLPDPDAGIQFVDLWAKLNCLWIADADDDGAITMEEAAAATGDFTLGGGMLFHHQKLSSFDEFRFFTGITSISDYAFANCTNLKSITIPCSVATIGGCAFQHCESLTSITIPHSVTSIGGSAFDGCYNLKDLTWNAKNCESATIPSTIENLTFGDEVEVIPNYFASGCIGLTSVTIPVTVTAIGSYAFRGCSGLTSIEIPKSVESVGGYAFQNCTNMTDVTINGSTIGQRAFQGCSLTDVTLNGGTIEPIAFYGCNLKDLTINGGTIGQQAFYGCSLEDLTINGGTIEQNAFYGSGLKKLTIGESVTTIGRYAFYNCEALSNVTIGNSVTTIGRYAFYNCEALSNVTIGNSVTTIGSNAFGGCSSLKSIAIPNSVNSLGEGLFYGCSNLKSVAIGKSVMDMGWSNFNGCDNLTSLYCLPLNPPSLYSMQFDNDWETNIQKFKSVTLYVPMEAVDAYKSTYPWCYFGNIVGLDPSLSDVNLDHEINIADINVIINNILSDDDDCLNEFMSDVNRDGEVNIADINVLIDKILRHQ